MLLLRARRGKRARRGVPRPAVLNTTIAIAPIDRSETPLLGQRKIRNMSYGDRDAKGLLRLRATEKDYHRLRAKAEETESEDGGWFTWQRLGGSLGLAGGHAFGDAWEKWSADHPEWFAMQRNGLVREYEINYGDFSITAELTSAESVNAPQCS